VDQIQRIVMARQLLKRLIAQRVGRDAVL